MLAYPDRLALAQLPTPLQFLPRLSTRVGKRIWMKRDDLTGSVASGNKVRKLEFIFAYAKKHGYTHVITCGGLQSNHCRATALLARQVGLSCSLILRGAKPAIADANLLLMQLAGTDIDYHPAAFYTQHLTQLLRDKQQSLAAQGFNALIVPTGGSDGLGIWGYIACAEELKNDLAQLNLPSCAIVHATGSGGTQAGLTLGAQLHGLTAPIYGINVCDDEAYFLQKVSADINEWQQRFGISLDTFPTIRVIDGYVGAGYAITSDAVLQCIAELVRDEGIVLDPVYTGKAFYGLLAEINKGRFADTDDIVFVHTGGIFGLYAYRDQLHEAQCV